MKKPIAVCFFALCVNNTHAQNSATQPPEDRIYKTNEPGVSPPEIIKKVDPDYSEIARNLWVNFAVVQLQIVINKEGVPGNFRVLAPFGYGLDEEAIKAVRRWRFKPAAKDGMPVSTLATVEVTFHFGLPKPPRRWISGEMRFSLDPRIAPPVVEKGSMPKEEEQEFDASVALEFTVTAEGRVRSVHRVFGSESAAEVMTRFLAGWKFRPATDEGRLVEATGRVRFSIGKGDATANRPLYGPAPRPAPDTTEPAESSSSSRDITGKVSGDMLVGQYQREPVLNGWHHGVIERDGDGLRWKNDAGVSWALTPDLKNGALIAGSQGNPYYDKQPERGRSFVIILTNGGHGGAVDGFEFLGEFYARVPMSDPTPLKSETAQNLPSVIRFCGPVQGGTLNGSNGSYLATYDNNRGHSTYTFELFTKENVRINRADEGGSTAVLTGRLSPQGNSIVDGKITWADGQTFPFRMAWGTAIDTLPEGDRTAETAIHGATLRPLDPASVDDSGKSKNSNVGAIIDLVNRSGRPVDIYWIDFSGNRVLYSSGVADGATLRMPTYLTHPWLAVASGTGGTKARGTGVRLAAFEAVTPNPKLDRAIRDVGVIAASSPASHAENEMRAMPPAIPEDVALTVIPAPTAKEAKEILDKAADVYSHITALRVSGKSEETQLNRGQELMADARFELAVQGREYYLRFKLHGVEAVAVSDGESTWKALVSRKQFSHVDAATVDDSAENEVAQRPKNDLYNYMGRSLFGEVSLLARKTTNLEMVREADYKLSSGRVRCYVIRAQSDKGQEELWIDKERFLVLDRIRTFKSGLLSRMNRFSLTTIEVNKEIPQSTFHFEAPKNWSEEELVLLPGEQGQSLTGSRAWRFTLKALDGERTELTEARGKVVVLDFWATWCPPCRKELPVIEKLSADFADKVLFYGVNDEDPGTVKDFIKKNQYHMTVLVDNNKEVHRRYGVSAIPTLLIIDKQGIIRKLFVGSRDEATLRKAVQSVVNLN